MDLPALDLMLRGATFGVATAAAVAWRWPGARSPCPPPVRRIAVLGLRVSAANPVLAINLPEQTIGRPNGTTMRFEIDASRKTRLLEGLDDIGQTLKHLDKIRDYEMRRGKEQPWL